MSPVMTAVFLSAGGIASGGVAGSDPQIWPLLLKMIAALALVVGAMLLLSAGLRRMRLGRGRGKEESIVIKETRPLGAKKMLCLVDVRGREMLLGITGERITFLSHIDTSDSNPSFDQVMDRQKDPGT